MTTTHTTDALDRLFGAVLATIDRQAVYLGDRLGWYRALAAGGALTAAELAERTGTAERYAREWLEQQASPASSWPTTRPMPALAASPCRQGTSTC